MKNKLFALTALFLVMLTSVISLTFSHDAQGAPLSAPTPVSATVAQGGQLWRSVTVWDAQTFTADANSSCYEIAGYALADIQYTIDQGTTNTTTVTMKWSNDGSSLVSGVNLVASNTADTTDMQQVQLFGRYMCLLADVTNSNTITITAKALIK